MTGRVKYLVFGVGMLVLAAGVSLSLWMLLARPEPVVVEAPAGNGAPSLSQALAQAMGLSEEEADELAERLQAAAPTGRGAAPTGGETSLAQALQQAMGLSEEEAGDLAERLQAAAEQAEAAAPAGGSAPGGAGDRTNIGDLMEFEVRDASGKLKQRGSSR